MCRLKHANIKVVLGQMFRCYRIFTDMCIRYIYTSHMYYREIFCCYTCVNIFWFFQQQKISLCNKLLCCGNHFDLSCCRVCRFQRPHTTNCGGYFPLPVFLRYHYYYSKTEFQLLNWFVTIDNVCLQNCLAFLLLPSLRSCLFSWHRLCGK